MHDEETLTLRLLELWVQIEVIKPPILYPFCNTMDFSHMSDDHLKELIRALVILHVFVALIVWIIRIPTDVLQAGL